MKMWNSSKVTRKSITSCGILPLLIFLFAGPFVLGQGVITPDASLPEKIEINRNVTSKFTAPEKQTLQEMNTASQAMADAKRVIEEASKDLPPNFRNKSVKNLHRERHQLLQKKVDLEAKKAELPKKMTKLETDRNVASKTVKELNSKHELADNVLANAYTKRNAEEIKKQQDAIIKMNHGIEDGTLNRQKTAQDIVDAKKTLRELAPGFTTRSPAITKILPDGTRIEEKSFGGFSSKIDKKGIVKRAELERAYLGKQIKKAGDVVSRNTSELKSVQEQNKATTKQIEAITKVDSALEVSQQARTTYNAARPKVVVATQRVPRDEAKARVAESQKILRQEVKSLNGYGNGVQEALKEYDDNTIAIKQFAGYLSLFSKLADEFPENPDPTKSMEFGGKLAEAAADMLFPALEGLKLDRNGRYTLTKAGDIQLAKLAELANMMLDARSKTQKAAQQLKTNEVEFKKAKHAYHIAELANLKARRDAIHQRLKDIAVQRTAEANDASPSAFDRREAFNEEEDKLETELRTLDTNITTLEESNRQYVITRRQTISRQLSNITDRLRNDPSLENLKVLRAERKPLAKEFAELGRE